ncbi:MAG TPA: hypothetical protein VNF04_17820 [Stellaceae bacterium]|nr:hypothetical protein [Stellaceae bacterium]
MEDVYSGGVASGTTVSYGGVETVSAGGVASGTSVASGGVEIVEAGGTAIGDHVDGGIQRVFGTASGTVVSGNRISLQNASRKQ